MCLVCECYGLPTLNTTAGPFLSASDCACPAGVAVGTLLKPPACLTAATQRGCQPLTGDSLSPRALVSTAEGRRRRDKEEETLLCCSHGPPV